MKLSLFYFVEQNFIKMFRIIPQENSYCFPRERVKEILTNDENGGLTNDEFQKLIKIIG